MKHTKEEIINALKVIKEECAEADCRCAGCPFGQKVECYGHDIYVCAVIGSSPKIWNLVDEEPEPKIWRAFK